MNGDDETLATYAIAKTKITEGMKMNNDSLPASAGPPKMSFGRAVVAMKNVKGVQIKILSNSKRTGNLLVA
jgi:hypothetical protein